MLQKLKNWWNAPLTYKRMFRDSFLTTAVAWAGWMIWIFHCEEARKEDEEAKAEAEEYERMTTKLATGFEES